MTRDACRRAARGVAAALSQASTGDAEERSRHLQDDAGWLSIDVINHLGAGVLGLHVDGAAATFTGLLEDGDADCLVN